MTTRYRMHRLARQASSAQEQPQNRRHHGTHSPIFFAAQHPTAFRRAFDARRRLDAALSVSVALVALFASILAPKGCSAADNPLQIVIAGVQRSEDAPFVSGEFHFLPGDYVYLEFQISGYGIQTANDTDVRKMSLTYEISPQDAKGTPLVPPATGVIKDELSPEDKNWTPKRRASFLLPSFIAAGKFRLHLSVKDLISNATAERDIPFNIGGVVVIPSATLTVQDFQFLRNEDDNEPLEVPAFRPGDTVYVRFNMTGFRLEGENKYQLSYGLAVTRPDGKAYLNEQTAAQLSSSSFYPVQFVPGAVAVTSTRAAIHGQYVILLTVHDLIGSQTYQLKRAFTIE
jgi:hypothetical protein